MKYEDYERALAEIEYDRNRASALSLEEYVAVDVAQQINSAEFQIERLQETLIRLKKAASALPKPKDEDVKDISPRIIHEQNYRFLGKRELQSKLYGWESK